MPDVSIGIVGAGMGGLTAALSLLRRGFDVHVYEQATKLTEVGAGVQISPNASRVPGDSRSGHPLRFPAAPSKERC